MNRIFIFLVSCLGLGLFVSGESFAQNRMYRYYQPPPPQQFQPFIQQYPAATPMYPTHNQQQYFAPMPQYRQIQPQQQPQPQQYIPPYAGGTPTYPAQPPVIYYYYRR